MFLAPSFVPLLEYASLRGLYALHDSPLPLLPCAMLRHLQRRAISGPRNCVEPVVCRIAILWRSAVTDRGSVLTHGESVDSPAYLSGRWDCPIGARRGVWGRNARDGQRVTGEPGTIHLPAGRGQVA